MKTLKIHFANFCARQSSEYWQKSAIIRRICRYGYWLVGWWDGTYAFEHTIRQDTYMDVWSVDTYPDLYRSHDFAPWTEDDDIILVKTIEHNGTREQMTIPVVAVDPANFVVRHSTSYCAWKIKELTGRWPLKREFDQSSSRQKRYDAKDWCAFLAQNGYTYVAKQPEVGKHYVGVNPEVGQYGQVYWFESTLAPFGLQSCWCSTYEHYKYTTCRVSLNNPAITWVEIS